MADATYQPKIYRKQGGNILVVASTGQITVESGGGINIESGGNITIDDGGQIVQPVVSETTAAALSNSGVSVITKGTTGTGANTYTIDAPATGVPKYLSATAANTSEHIIVQANTNVSFDPAGSKDKLKIVAPGLYTLIGVSTAAYQVTAMSTTLAFATS